MVYVKGGAWSNTEDEVLKAAISKYGLNQWARVSTLLPKKTAKQCRARWQEYLDPRILKSEWSQDEDEKLLRIARLMPNQWRSIASMIGRTATQCVERYQTLLDEASGVAGSDEMGLSGLGAETLSAVGSSASKVGDLNVNAEHREAIPDAVDLDEDEKEMLSEARARLANTKGKKATRKARERMLEESKRVALLQKRRELKQAGITTKLKAPKKKFSTQVDYNADIPFEHAPTSGFYETSEETSANDQSLRNFKRTVQNVGLKDEKRADKKPKKQQISVEKEARPLDDVPFKPVALQLPEPEFQEDESNSLLKLEEKELDLKLKQRIADVGPSVDERINAAAIKIKQEKTVQSALLIKDQEDEDAEEGEDKEAMTVNTEVQHLSPKLDMKSLIRERLTALPKPKNDFEIVLDDDEEEDVEEVSEQKEELKEVIPEDHGEKERLLALRKEEEHKKGLLRRSQAIQKGLPIPKINSNFTLSSTSSIEKAVLNEMVKLIRSDSAKLEKASGVQLMKDLEEKTIEMVKLEIAKEVNEDDLKEFQSSFVSSPMKYNTALHSSSLVTELQSLVEKCNETEKLLVKHSKGYTVRSDVLRDESLKDIAELKEVDRVLTAMQMLQYGESVACEARSVALREEVDKLVQAEQRAQEVYLQLRQ